MKIKYLGTVYHYKPEYDIDDFIRVNCIEDYKPQTVIKLMRALYPIRLQENYPEYFNIYDSENV
jgi:hypothetical protein